MQEHVKTHSEEYKFNCKFCNSAFMNRNVMVSHQKTCYLNKDSAVTSMPLSIPGVVQPAPLTAADSLAFQPPPEKRFKVVLNSDEIKNLIRAKDEEIRQQEEANRSRMALLAKPSPMVTIPTSVLMQEEPDIKHEPIDAAGQLIDDDDDDDNDDDDEEEEGVDPLDESLKPNVKPVVRKRPPVFPFEVSIELMVDWGCHSFSAIKIFLQEHDIFFIYVTFFTPTEPLARIAVIPF
jgi:hypothetical protein